MGEERESKTGWGRMGVVVKGGRGEVEGSREMWTEGGHSLVCCVQTLCKVLHLARALGFLRSALYANRLYLRLYRKYNPERLSSPGEGQPLIVGEPGHTHLPHIVLSRTQLQGGHLPSGLGLRRWDLICMIPYLVYSNQSHCSICGIQQVLYPLWQGYILI